MDITLRQRVSMLNPIHFLALGFGSGLIPKAPGTFGSLAAIPIVILCSVYFNFTIYVLVALFASVAGIYVCGKTAKDMQVHDDSSIVWDEIAGMLITMIAVPMTWQTLLTGFLLFRFFDIAKPWPISFLDKNVHGGIGIMMDDVLAGLFSLGCMHLILHLSWI